MNPVQIETGEFDEAIQIEEDFPAESKCTWPTHTHKCTRSNTQSHMFAFISASSIDSSHGFLLLAGLVYSRVSLAFNVLPTAVNFNIHDMMVRLFDLRHLGSALRADRHNDCLPLPGEGCNHLSLATVTYLSSRPQVCGRWLPLRCQHLWLPVSPGINKIADVLI